MYVEQSSPYEACFNAAVSGLVGTISVRVIDNDGVIVDAASTAGIIEAQAGSGYYCAERTSSASVGQYSIQWSSDGSFTPPNLDAEDLVVVTASTNAVLPPIPTPVEGGLGFGPCTTWIDGDDVAACCSVEASSGVMFDEAAAQAQSLLFELSGRLFPGECSKTVRPACDNCLCGYQVLSRGHIVGPWDWGASYSSLCDHCLTSCSPSRVKLSGYPVRSITEIKIDGDVLAPTEYTLWKNRYVTRLNNGRWPLRQNLTLEDTEDGTFSIEYSYGTSPPQLGIAAAAQLGCEIYKACANATGGTGACVLPTGVTRITRQGVTIEKQAFTSWGYTSKNLRGIAPGWRTGMPLVDAFLASYNAAGLIRRPVFWSPGKHRYAQEFG